MANRWWEALLAPNSFDRKSVRRTLDAVEAAISHYQEPITAMLNDVPDIDKPFFLACLKLTFEAVKSTNKDLADVTDAVLRLPISTIAVLEDHDMRGGADDGV